METLKIKKETARRLFNKAPDFFKEILAENFSKEELSLNITDRIKTYGDAVEYCRETAEGRSLLDKIILLATDTEDEAAYKGLKVICFALNEGNLPDYFDTNVKKWFPIFSLSSGFGFSHSFYYCSLARAAVGFRLCFKNENLATYAGKQFLAMYQSYLTK